MVLIDSFAIEFELFLFGIIATILIGIASKDQAYLRRWLYAIILFTIGLLSNFMRNFFEIFEYFSIAFYGVAVILTTFIIIKEYYDTFFKDPERKIINKAMGLGTPFIFSSIIFGFFLLLVDLILQIRITLRKKSLTYRFLCIALLGAVLTTSGNIFINLGFEGAIAVNVGADLFFTSMLITTGVVAILEKRVMRSEIKYKESFNRASFYKDLVAHDINNILQNIQTSSDLLSLELQEGENENIKELQLMIKQQVERGSRLVKNVRTLSEIEEFKYSLNEIDAIKVLKDSINFTKTSNKNKSLKVELNTELDKIIIKANELLIDVFENVLNNAIKHNDNQEIIVLIYITKKTTEGGSYYHFEFKDNAKGIPEHLKEQIFLRSIQKDRSVSGMGLGLSLVRKIIESYNGKIWVEDRVRGDPSKGSNFILTIPSSSSDNP